MWVNKNWAFHRDNHWLIHHYLYYFLNSRTQLSFLTPLWSQPAPFPKKEAQGEVFNTVEETHKISQDVLFPDSF